MKRRPWQRVRKRRRAGLRLLGRLRAPVARTPGGSEPGLHAGNDELHRGGGAWLSLHDRIPRAGRSRTGPRRGMGGGARLWLGRTLGGADRDRARRQRDRRRHRSRQARVRQAGGRGGDRAGRRRRSRCGHPGDHRGALRSPSTHSVSARAARTPSTRSGFGGATFRSGRPGATSGV